MEAEYTEIELGADVCRRIKDIYYPNIHWSDCHNDIVTKFGLFKKIMKKIYPDDNIIDILKKVHKFDTLDIQEVFGMEKDYLKDEVILDETGKPKYDAKVVWVPVPVEKTEVLGEIRKMLK